MTKEFPVVWV
jgi:hypothetical protein